MGDERKYSPGFERSCPECGERLNRDAKVCACGWGRSKKGDSGPRHDMTCSWHYGQLRCRYPVGLFMQGEFRGLCAFHRARDRGHEAALIAEESQTATKEQYLDAAKKQIYGSVDNPLVRKLRAQLRERRGGNAGRLATPLLPREPGQDEAEAA